MKNRTRQHDVFLVDDDPAVRSAVADDLKDLGCKVSCFARASDCLELLPKRNCNLFITDVKMPGVDGLTLLSRVKHVAPWVPIMVVAGSADIPMSVRAIKLGAVDFVEKPLEREVFRHKVETILKQDELIDARAGQPLTKTERRVLKLILDDEGNKQIAFTLKRALRTVERHRSSIMRKFGVDSIVGLVKKAAFINTEKLE